VVLATAEYRYHFPRSLDPIEDPRTTPLFGQPFRFHPQTRYGLPDWDLIGRVFIDAARVSNTDRLVFEQDNTLIGAGLGVELLIRDNVGVRVDWGVALHEVNSGRRVETEVGDNRFHFVFSLSF